MHESFGFLTVGSAWAVASVISLLVGEACGQSCKDLLTAPNGVLPGTTWNGEIQLLPRKDGKSVVNYPQDHVDITWKIVPSYSTFLERTSYTLEQTLTKDSLRCVKKYDVLCTSTGQLTLQPRCYNDNALCACEDESCPFDDTCFDDKTGCTGQSKCKVCSPCHSVFACKYLLASEKPSTFTLLFDTETDNNSTLVSKITATAFGIRGGCEANNAHSDYSWKAILLSEKGYIPAACYFPPVACSLLDYVGYAILGCSLPIILLIYLIKRKCTKKMGSHSAEPLKYNKSVDDV